MNKIIKTINYISAFRKVVDQSKLSSNELLLSILVCQANDAEISISQTEIFEILSITKPQLTRLIQKLEKKGLILKTRSQEDNRVTLITPTPKLMNEIVEPAKGIQKYNSEPLLNKIEKLNSRK